MFLFLCILRSWPEKKTNVLLIKLLKHHFSESDVSSTMKTHHCRIILEYTLYVVDCVPLPARVLSLFVLRPRGLDSKQEVGLRQALHSLCLLNLLQNRSNNIVQVAELLLRGLDGYAWSFLDYIGLLEKKSHVIDIRKYINFFS